MGAAGRAGGAGYPMPSAVRQPERIAQPFRSIGGKVYKSRAVYPAGTVYSTDAISEPDVKPFEISVVLAMAFGGGTPAAELAETRTFELREYHAAPGKLDALHARFRDRTVELMERHGIASVAYLVSADGRDGVLRAILAYPDPQARKRAWESFVLDPEWQAVRRQTDADGRLVEKIREYPLTPTADGPVLAARSGEPGRRYELLFSRMNEPDREAAGTVVGSWTTADPRSPGETLLVRLVAVRPATADHRRVAFYRGPLEPTPAAAEPPVKSSILLSTDYSPLK